ncbi:MAG TPA: choice-of-anchor tandem repeat GloVer-containing protein [Terriglobales bacterium]|jgi:uncharacterized repeat protein (TIGR03803 family)|nr:choice-of-anchor tandem repeat GloVer-containing protein [Terriglobales bacterium]
MTKISACKMAAAFFLLCVATAVDSPAQTFTNLFTFDRTNGWEPVAPLTQGIDGNFYGVTAEGGSGSNPVGTVFKVTPAGHLTSLYNFCSQSNCADGASPESALLLATDGNFYGTASEAGGNIVGGTVYKITSLGKLTTLYSFCAEDNCTDGASPQGGVVEGVDGNFYGTTRDGGNGPLCISNGYCGNVFKMTPSGAVTTIYNFCSLPNCTDGLLPTTPLVQGTDGNLYGATSQFDTFPATIFKITTSGKLTTLYTFCEQQGCTNGDAANALLLGTDGNFYGITSRGGASGPNGLGTVFKMTPGGTLTTLYSFCSLPSCLDGADPGGGLVEGTDGNFYGTTSEGGQYGSGTLGGTIFKITPQGTITTLYSFCAQQPNCADGTDPFGPPTQGTDGNFYGTTSGGNVGSGTIYKLATGLGPFIRFLPAGGKVGSEVGILGTNLTGATSVMFNGSSAKFSVPLPTLILTHVPTGAKSGMIKVTTPSGTLTSNVPFHVIP